MRPSHINRYEYLWKAKLAKKDKISCITAPNVIALPVRRNPGSSRGKGGIIDCAGNYVPKSYTHIGPHVLIGPCYDIEDTNLHVLDDEYIYLGAYNSHWGEFIVHCTGRLWYAQQHPEMKCIFLARDDEKIISPNPPIDRFLELAGIGDITFISNPTRIASIHIPEESYIPTSYYTMEYLETFQIVAQNSQPSISCFPEKIYFSRANFNHSSGKEVGNELLEELFRLSDFHIVYPEKETFDNQLAYIYNARILSAVEGTLIHNLILAQNKNLKVYLIKKMPYNNPRIVDSMEMNGLLPIICDFYAFKYPCHGVGPFIFVYNEQMQKFVSDKNINVSNNLFFSEYYLSKSIKLYLYDYYKKWKSNFSEKLFSNNYYHDNFYDSELLYEWLNKYLKYEI